MNLVLLLILNIYVYMNIRDSLYDEFILKL